MEELVDMVTEYKFLRNFAFFLLNVYIFLGVFKSSTKQFFT